MPQLTSSIFDSSEKITSMQYNKQWQALRNNYPYDGSNIYGEIENFIVLLSHDLKNEINTLIKKNMFNQLKNNIILLIIRKGVRSVIGAWSQIILNYRNQIIPQ